MNHKTPVQLLREILEAFPQADPASEFYNNEIDGCEAVNFISQIVPAIRGCLEAPPPKVALVIEDGIVQCVTSDRPGDVLPQTFIVIEYDSDATDRAEEDEIVRVPQGDKDTVVNAFVRIFEPGQALIDLESVYTQLETD